MTKLEPGQVTAATVRLPARLPPSLPRSDRYSSEGQALTSLETETPGIHFYPFSDGDQTRGADVPVSDVSRMAPEALGLFPATEMAAGILFRL